MPSETPLSLSSPETPEVLNGEPILVSVPLLDRLNQSDRKI